MKKQTKSNIKAHLIRSSFYVLLLLAVCVIPFALAQRNTTRHKAVSKPKHLTTAATSRQRNDVASSAVKAKPAAPSNRFSHAGQTRARTPDGVACWYDFTSSGATFVPGVDDIGNHTDDGLTFITLPFTVNLYGQAFTGANVGSNGALFFGNADATFGITCPPPFGVNGTTEVLGPYWGDQCTNTAGCGGGESCAACGVFTTTTGSAPDRIFYIEWRTQYFNQTTALLDYEIALYENGTPPFSIIYSDISAAGAPNDSQLVVGQKLDESCNTEIGCDTTGGTAPPVSSGQAFDALQAATPTPTPTPACTPLTFEGTIDASDPTQTDRMFRDGVLSTCAAPKVCPGPFGDGQQHHYDSYTITNNTGASACVSVDASTACVGTNYIFLVAYNGSFNPADLCENYLADQGSSPDPSAPPGPFSFDMADGQTVVIVVSEVTADAGCPDYTVTVSNLCNGGGGPCTLQPWNEVANYPEILESPAICTDGTFVYGAGGNAAGIPTAGFYKYDPSANSWSTLASVPQTLYDARSVYDSSNNKIYLFGGIDGTTFVPINTLYIYDIATDSWTSGNPMPGNRFFPAVVYDSVTDLMYIAGGIDESFLETDTTWIYDPNTGSYDTSTAPNIPAVMGGSAVSLVGQTMYLQGSFGTGATTLNYAYDIVANTWTQKADLPAPRYEAAGGSIGTNTYVTGGGDPFVAPGSVKGQPKKSKEVKGPNGRMARPDTTFSTTFVYDTVGDSWSNGPNTNVGHSFTGGTAIGNKLLVACGFDGVSGDSNIVETSNCGAGTPTPTPTPGTPTPTPTPIGSCPPVITESADQSIVSGNSVSCNDGFGHADNSYFRAFNMNTFTGGAAYNITAVEFGIEQATSGTGTGQPVEVRLYTNHGSPFPAGDWQSNMIADVPINIPDQSLTVFVQPVTVTVPAGTLELVYELFTPNGEAVGNLFFVGSNPDGQSADSYLEAADCGVTVPTPTQDIGFPNMMIVFNVDGSCVGTPTPTPTVTPTPVITPTPTPIITPTPTPVITPTPTPIITPTPTVTPTPPPRSPTPRPRPTPHPRPTPP